MLYNHYKKIQSPGISETLRKCIGAQGSYGLENDVRTRINYWLQLAPAICMIWKTIRATIRSSRILWSLVPLALPGVILPGHPFDILYNYRFRRSFIYLKIYLRKISGI